MYIDMVDSLEDIQSINMIQASDCPCNNYHIVDNNCYYLILDVDLSNLSSYMYHN